jgi:glutathione peroxidase
MSLLKKIINRLYNLRMKISGKTGIGINIKSNKNEVIPLENFYSLNATDIKGKNVSFEIFKNKKVLVVNLASQCGFTPQYNELEDLHRRYKDKVEVIGFPSNDFGGQEPGGDEEIANFCRLNFGVSFPLFHKDHVSGASKQKVYQWLTDPAKNGWNNKEPSWNFCKYLVNEQGQLVNFYSSAVSPTAPDIINLL